MSDRKGTKLFQFLDINQPSQAQITAADLGCNCEFTYATECRGTIPNFFYINQEKSSANSSYNSLQASLRTSGWHGISSQANFVWSHSIDTASDLEDFEPNEAQPRTAPIQRADHGNSSFDIRRRFTWNFTYQFPKMGGVMSQAEEWLGPRWHSQPAGWPALAPEL